MSRPTPNILKPDVLFVDLDNTLVATDVFKTALLRLLRRRPILVFCLPFLLSKVRAALKHAVAQQEPAHPDVPLLPYRTDVIALINQFKESGKPVVLATASSGLWAQRVAEHLGLFDAVLASDATHNLKGPAKLDAIQAYCRQQGHATFGYVGDSHADLPIWAQAAGVYVVRPSRSLARALRRIKPPDLILDGSSPQIIL